METRSEILEAQSTPLSTSDHALMLRKVRDLKDQLFGCKFWPSAKKERGMVRGRVGVVSTELSTHQAILLILIRTCPPLLGVS